MRNTGTIPLAVAYGVGVWGTLTAWAALAEYVLPTRGQALGKLGSFQWVFVINLLPALLCTSGLAAGLLARRARGQACASSIGVAAFLGLLFPLTLGLLRPAFAFLGHGLLPALVWCMAGSVVAGALLGGWMRRRGGHEARREG